MSNFFRSCSGLVVCCLTAASAWGAVRVARTGDRWIVENSELRVTVEPATATLSVEERSSRFVWTQPAGARTAFRNVQELKGSEHGVGFDSDFSGGGKTYTMSLKLTLPDHGADFRVEADMANRAATFDNVAFLSPFVLDSTAGVIVVADYSNGHAYPVEMKPFPRRRFDIGNIDMPWIGVCDLEKGQGYALIAETPDDASFDIVTFDREGRTVSAPRLMWG